MRTIRGKQANRKVLGTRILALICVAVLAVTLVPSAAAAEISNGITPTCDEAYYATLDYYGNLTNGSVVKSYAMNGVNTLTDYGTYDSINNLTDGTEPSNVGGKTTFSFGDDVPDHFCFEGVTSEPFEKLPWTLSLSYTLNGVPTEAEDLAGKTGEVEININAIPNAAASDYQKNNYTLEAMAVFNQNDILSLEAEGAQVQLVGNLRVVLFLALPGEEQHFTIRVGSNDFSFGGMTFLMVPATLSQLDQIADLSQKKDDLEDDYDKLNSSIDTMLDAVNNMSGSLYETADGLDELNEARGMISAGKGNVYAQADSALDDLAALNESLNKITGHLDPASQAVTDLTDDLNALTKTAVSLQSQLDDAKDNLDDLQDELDDIHDLTGDSSHRGDLQKHLESLGDTAASLKTNLAKLKTSVSDLDVTIGGNENSITVNGQTLDNLNTALDSVKQLDSIYKTVGGGSSLSYQNFLVAAAMMQAAQEGETLTVTDAATNLQQVSATTQSIKETQSALDAKDTTKKHTLEEAETAYFAGVAAQLGDEKAAALKANYDKAIASSQLMQQVYTTVVGGTSVPMDREEFVTAMTMVSAIQGAPASAATVLAAKDTYAKNAQSVLALYDLKGSGLTGGILNDLSNLCGELSNTGLTGDLTDLTKLIGDTLDNLDDLCDTADEVIDKSGTMLTEVQKLNDTVNKYVPELKSTLSDTKEMLTTMTTTVSDTHGFLSSFESLAKKAGTKLDSGTKKTLTGLAATLRKTAESVATTADVKSAKDNISSIIEDVWNDHTGDVDNLLNMDSTASAESLTSTQNAAPQSVQVLIRTQEIKVDKAAQDELAAKKADNGSFWSRIAAMFKGIGSDIAGIFKH